MRVTRSTPPGHSATRWRRRYARVVGNDALLRWLESIGLEQHHSALVAEGVDLDIVGMLTDGDLRSLGLNLGDRRRLRQSAASASGFEQTATKPDDAPKIERRNITVLFCDLVGSTTLSSALDDELFARVVRDYSATCARAIEKAGGRVAKFLGDGVMGYFGYPHATGDEAQRAIEAGFLIQKAVAAVDARYDATVETRVGIASGTAIVGEVVGDQIDALGDTPNLAARVESAAEVGSVTVAPLTRRLANDLFEFTESGPFDLKGFTEPIALFRAERPLDTLAALAEGDAQPVVGRDRETRQLEELRQRSLERPVTVRIDGEPGIGKSSLVRQTIADARAAGGQVFMLQCSEHETANSLYPLRRLLEAAAGIDIRFSDVERLDALDMLAARLDRPEVASVGRRLMGLGPATEVSAAELRAEIFDSIVSIVAKGLAGSPSVLVVEDLQWCDPTSLELLELIREAIGNAPIFVMVTQRSGMGDFDDTLLPDEVIRLDSFDHDRTRELVESITGFDVSAEVVGEIRSRSGGVPLYITELTRSLIEAEALVAGETALRLVHHRVPDTLQDSLQARLDRLPNARDVAPVAAAIGLDFSISLLNAAAADDMNVEAAIRELEQAQLITTDADGASFRHALIRSVAYNRLLRERKEEIHQRIGDTMIDRFAEQAATEPQVVARHLSLGTSPIRSVDWWYAAAEVHARISAHSEVLANLHSALAVLDDAPVDDAHHAAELRLQLLRAGTLRATEGFAADIVGSVYERAVELSTLSGDLDSMSAALNGIYSFNLVRDRYERAGQVADQLLQTARASADPRRSVIAHRAVGVVAFHTGRFQLAQTNLEESIRLYHEGDYREDAWLIGTDHATTAGSFLAMNELVSGLGDSVATIDAAEALANDIDHFHSWAQVMTYRGFMAVISRQWSEAQEAGDELLDRLADRKIPLMEATARFWSAAGRFHLGDESGLDDLWTAADSWWSTGARSYAGFARCVIAEAEGLLGRHLVGLETVGESFTIIAENGERWALSECHRIAAELHALAGHDDRAQTERQRSIDVARQQGASLWLSRNGL